MCPAGENVKWFGFCGKQYGSSSKELKQSSYLHFWVYTQKNGSRVSKRYLYSPVHSQHCSRSPDSWSKASVHQWVNGEAKCGMHICFSPLGLLEPNAMQTMGSVSQALEVGSPRSRRLQIHCLLSWLLTASSHAKGMRELSGISFVRVPTQFMKVDPLLPEPPKGPISYCHHLGG